MHDNEKYINRFFLGYTIEIRPFSGICVAGALDRKRWGGGGRADHGLEIFQDGEHNSVYCVFQILQWSV